jgi:hypothetical protein
MADMRSRFGIAAFLAATSIVAQPGPTEAQMEIAGPNSVLTNTEAYVLFPAELICGPTAEQVSFSPSGRNVAVIRTIRRLSTENAPIVSRTDYSRSAEDHEVIFWNASIRKPVTLWQTAQPMTTVRLSDWMPGTESLFALIDVELPADPQRPGEPPNHEFRLVLLGLGIERAVPVPLPLGNYVSIDVSVSPTQELAVVNMRPRQSGVQDIYLVVHRNGRTGPLVDVPPTFQASPLWDSSGRPVLVSREVVDGKSQKVYRAVDLRTGQVRVLTSPPAAYTRAAHAQQTLPFRLVSQAHDLPHRGATDRAMPIWLETPSASEHPSALVTADGSSPTLLPGGTVIVFRDHSSLWHVPIAKMPKAEYLTARKADLKQRALSNARQVGTAARMYAYDHDETFPGPDDLEANLTPYAGNAAIFQGFTYTFAGGSFAEIGTLADAVLGSVAGPGGRAVVYADGHVKWVDN